MELKSRTRPMNSIERKIIKKSLWIIVFVILVFSLFVWVAHQSVELSLLMNCALIVIPLIVTIIFNKHYCNY